MAYLTNPYAGQSYHNHTHSITNNWQSYRQPFVDPTTLPNGSLTQYIEAQYEAITKSQRKEPAMSTLEKIRSERREKRERAEIEALFNEWDSAQMGDYADGTIAAWTWKPKGEDKTYKYVALWTSKKWYTTGPSSPRDGQELEEWISWMIEKKVWPSTLRLIHPEEQS